MYSLNVNFGYCLPPVPAVRPRRRCHGGQGNGGSHQGYGYGGCHRARPYYLQDRACNASAQAGLLLAYGDQPALSAQQNDALSQFEDKENKVAEAKSRLQKMGFNPGDGHPHQLGDVEFPPSGSTIWTKQNGNGQKVVMYLSPDGTITPSKRNP